MLKILVVDDDPKRYSFFDIDPILSLLDRDHIHVCNNIKDALSFLSKNKYDVLIVDMAIPATAWASEIQNNGGVVLLQHLQEDSELISPSFIIGLTASTDDNSDVSSFFSTAPWLLLKIGASGIDWQTRIFEALSHASLIKKQESTIEYDIDVCIVTALADPELSALLATNISWDADPQYLDSNTLVRMGVLLGKGGVKLSIVAACALRMGSVETALLSSKLISKYRPRLLAMCGICAGVQDKVNYGDAILATPVWDWTSSKWDVDASGNEIILPSPHYLECSREVVSRFQLLAQDNYFLNDLRDKWQGIKPAAALRAHYGPVASGPIVVADGKTLLDIKSKQNRQVLGLEMEAYGLYAAAQNSGLPKPLCLSIKSVCDFADPRKNDDMQKYAAYTSASTLFEFLFRYGKDIRGLS